MKKKLILIIVIIGVLVQSIFIGFINKNKSVKTLDIKNIEKEKNIKEIFLDSEKVDKLEINNYSKINNKWIGEFKFEGSLKEAKSLISNIKDFNINSYNIIYEEEKIYIQGFLEHK